MYWILWFLSLIIAIYVGWLIRIEYVRNSAFSAKRARIVIGCESVELENIVVKLMEQDMYSILSRDGAVYMVHSTNVLFMEGVVG